LKIVSWSELKPHIDVFEADGKGRIGLFVANNPVNWRDPFGLYEEYSGEIKKPIESPSQSSDPCDPCKNFDPDATYEALNAMLGGFGPSTGNPDAELAGAIAGIVAPTPGGKAAAATKATKLTKFKKAKTPSEALENLESIEKAQDAVKAGKSRKLIDCIKKSEQKFKAKLKNIKTPQDAIDEGL